MWRAAGPHFVPQMCPRLCCTLQIPSIPLHNPAQSLCIVCPVYRVCLPDTLRRQNNPRRHPRSELMRNLLQGHSLLINLLNGGFVVLCKVGIGDDSVFLPIEEGGNLCAGCQCGTRDRMRRQVDRAL